MAVRKYKPTSNGRRNMSVLVFDDITTDTPEKSLLAPKNKKGGRNNSGKITVRHQGGGNKQKYRIIDFKRNKDGIPATVKTIEMILTEVQTLHYYFMQMVKRDIF